MNDPIHQEGAPVIHLPFYARLALVLLSVVLILFLMAEAKSIIIPLFFSLLIAFMLLPITRWLEHRRLPRSVAALCSILIFVILVAGLVFLLGQQIADFTKDLPQLGKRLQAWAGDLQGWVNRKYHLNYSRQIEYINKAGAAIVTYASVIAQAFFVALSGFVIWTIFVFIFTFFILTHRNLLKKFVVCLFSNRYHPRVNEVIEETRLLANGYVVGLMIEMAIVAVLNVIVLLLFGIKYALLLGVLAAVLNIIPYIGIYTATAIAALVTISNNTPGASLKVIIVLIVVHFIDANILMPRIVGSRVKMNPLITIVAVLSGSILWGISGTFLFIPLAAMLKIIFERVDGLRPWAILMGTDEEEKKPPKVRDKQRPKA
jgi:predicted PurR-regulated permease PerM